MKNKSLLPFLFIIISVLVASILLIWIDYETKTWSDVFSKGNMMSVLVFYDVPAILVASLLYFWFKKHLDHWLSAIIAVFLGIPSAFIMVIIILKIAFLF